MTKRLVETKRFRHGTVGLNIDAGRPSSARVLSPLSVRCVGGGGVVHAQQRRRMNIGVVGRDDDCRAASFTPPIEVVHAFGSCPDRVRDNVCALDDGRVVYVVGSRVAVKATAESSVSGASSASSSSRSSNDRLEFLSTGLRVARVTALTCSPEKGFVAVCYKGVVDGPNQGVAYATVYHMPTRPRPSRVKTLSYERPRRQQRQRGSSFSGSGSIEGTSRYDSSSTTSSSGGGIGPGGRKRRTHTPPPPSSTSATAEFVSATFSHDSRFLVVLDGSPEWTLVWFEWKTGKRMYTLQLDSPVHRYRCVCTPGICANQETNVSGCYPSSIDPPPYDFVLFLQH